MSCLNMFTGLIQTVGEVLSLKPTLSDVAGPARLTIRPRGWDYRPRPGDSIAISGCCLTVAGPVGADGSVPFDVVPQTLRLTTLGGLKAGSRVNLEHAARLDTLMGGHLVQGHVDGLGRVVGVQDTLTGGERGVEGGGEGGEYRLRIAPAAGLMEFAPPKGSVTVAGVSLTLAEVEPHGGDEGTGAFEVALIPTTLEETTLGELVVGDEVNLEMDVTAKMVVHWLKNFGQGQ
jgi:riboflavin synthase